MEMVVRPLGRFREGHRFPHSTHLRQDRQKGGDADGVPKRFGAEGLRHWGENVYGRAETSTGPGGALPLYSITQVYLSPEFHLGEAIISKAVIPRSVSDVTRATPTAKGVPPQFSKSSV